MNNCFLDITSMISFECSFIEINPPSEAQADKLSNFLYAQTNIIGDNKKDLLYQWKLLNNEARPGFACAMAVHEGRLLVGICTITF